MNPIQQALEALNKADAALQSIHVSASKAVDMPSFEDSEIHQEIHIAYEALSKYQDGWVLVKKLDLEEAYRDAAYSDGYSIVNRLRGKISTWLASPKSKGVHSARQHMEGE